MLNISSISSVLSHPTWDVLVIFFFIAAGFFYGFSAGIKRLIAVLFGLYTGQLIFENLHFLDFFVKGMDLTEIFLFRIVAFAIIVLILSYFFSKTIFTGGYGETKIWWHIFLLSFLEVGLLMSVVFRLFPASDIFTFSPVVSYVFASRGAFFWWLVLPLCALFVIMRRHKGN